MTATELHVTFVTNTDQCHPIQVINRIIEQLDIDLKRSHVHEYVVDLGHFTAIDNDRHILIYQVKEDGEKVHQNSRQPEQGI